MKDLGCLNKALLSKWCWRFARKGGGGGGVFALWNDVIKTKYAEGEGGWCSRKVRVRRGLG